MITINFYPVIPGIGHLTITLDGLRKKANGEPVNFHLSFYPETISQLEMLKNLFFRLHSIAIDGDDVTKAVRIPSQETNGVGLSEKAIYDWYVDEFSVEDKPCTEKNCNDKQSKRDVKYGFLDNNCSSYVYYALLVGQKQAASLGNKLLCEKSWLWPSTPNHILDVSHSLALKILQPLHAKDNNGRQVNLQSLLNIINNSKEFSPFQEAGAIFSQIERMPETRLPIMLKKPFCRSIKKVFKIMLSTIAEEPRSDVVNIICNYAAALLDNFDFTIHAEKFIELNSYLAKANDKYGMDLYEIFQAAIKEKMLPSMRMMIEDLVNPYINDKRRIDRLMHHLKHRVVDNHNPHSDKFFAGTKRDLGWWVRMFGQPSKPTFKP